MAPAKRTPTKTKPVRKTKRCKNPACKKPFTTASLKRVYCTTECQQALNASKRKTTRVNNASRSAFFYYLAKECKRAGTLQILQGHTPESLAELHRLYKQSFRVNQYGDVDHFQLSHIAAVKGANTLGLLHAENLVISPTGMNRAHGVKHYGAGKCISRTSINPRHSVDKDEPEGAVLDRVIAYLGEDVVAATVKLANIKPTDRQKDLAWLRDNLDATNLEHSVHIDKLDSMKGKQARELRAEIEGREAREYGIKRNAHSAFGVLRLELNRHAEYRPELQEFAGRLQAIYERKYNPWVVQEEHEQALFDILHGRDVEEVQDVLDSLIASNIGKIVIVIVPEPEVFEYPDGIVERISHYMPISIPLCRMRTDTGWHYDNWF